MKFAHFFVDRPIFASVLSIVIVLVGAHRLCRAAGRAVSRDRAADDRRARLLSGRQCRDRRRDRRDADRAGDQRRRGHALHVLLVDRATARMSLTITFKLGTNLDKAQVLVQNRVAIADAAPAGGGAPARRHHAQELARPDDGRAHALAGRQLRPALHLATTPRIRVRDELLRLDGVGDVIIFGEREYSLRVWLDPDKLAAYRHDRRRRRRGAAEQNVQVAGGALGAAAGADRTTPSSSPCTTQGRFEDARQFRRRHRQVDRRTGGSCACGTWRASSSARRTTSPTPTSTASRRWRSPSSSGPAPTRSPPRTSIIRQDERAEARFPAPASTTRSSTTRPSSSPSRSTRSTRRCSRR